MCPLDYATLINELHPTRLFVLQVSRSLRIILSLVSICYESWSLIRLFRINQCMVNLPPHFIHMIPFIVDPLHHHFHIDNKIDVRKNVVI